MQKRAMGKLLGRILLDIVTKCIRCASEPEIELLCCAHGYAPNQEQVDLTSVDFFRYYGAPGGQEFHHYRVNGGGHDWFGVWGSMDVVSTEVMWDFFSAQCAGEFTGVSESSPAQVWLEWTRQGIRADRACLLEVFDAAGRCTAQHRMFPGETWAPATSGITLIRGTDSNGNQEVLKAH